MQSPAVRIPELEAAIDAHARAVCGGDQAAAEQLLETRALEGHRAGWAAASANHPFQGFEVLARARIGSHYIVKVRWHSASGEVLWQNRWAQIADGRWLIAEVEDLTIKRTPWADIPALREAARARDRNG
jgi:hypothetical protein